MKKVVYLSLMALMLIACEKEELDSGSESTNNSGTPTQVSIEDQIIGHWESHQDELDYDFNLKFCNDGTYLKDFKYNWQFIPCAVDYVEEGSWSVVGDTILLISQSGAIQKYGVNTIVSNQSLGVNFPTCSGGRMNFNYSFVSSNGCAGGTGGTGGTGGGTPPSAVTDIDGNQYTVIQIGSQYWLKEDLEVTRFSDGSPLNQESWQNPTNWVSSSNPTYMEVDHSTTPYSTSSDGLVYNYVSGTDNRGLCPNGFRVPTVSDVEILLSNYSTPVSAANALKSSSMWMTYFVGFGASPPFSLISGNGTNSSGFNAKPSGYIVSGDATYEGNTGMWLINDNTPYHKYLAIGGTTFFEGDPAPADIISGGQSKFHKCRCIYEL